MHTGWRCPFNLNKLINNDLKVAYPRRGSSFTIPSRTGKCWFLRRWENAECPEKGFAEQSSEPTVNSSHNWQRVLSPGFEPGPHWWRLPPLRLPCSWFAKREIYFAVRLFLVGPQSGRKLEQESYAGFATCLVRYVRVRYMFATNMPNSLPLLIHCFNFSFKTRCSFYKIVVVGWQNKVSSEFGMLVANM